MEQPRKASILFLCTGNSCRSQMAEGFARALKADRIEAFSAGVMAKGVDPRAIRAMAEAGIDISSHRSKDLKEFSGRNFDYVVTVCNKARESCPVFPGNTRLVHQGFDDPPELAASAENEEAAMAHYRRVRDQIRAFVQEIPANLEAASDPVIRTASTMGGFLNDLFKKQGG